MNCDEAEIGSMDTKEPADESVVARFQNLVSQVFILRLVNNEFSTSQTPYWSIKLRTVCITNGAS